MTYPRRRPGVRIPSSSVRLALALILSPLLLTAAGIYTATILLG
ncbi:MAG: hypothetical protein OXG37_11410 [Actinomycetia bacterium]|nr:hypothetical protein [Actinomycetes bacterium]